MKKIGIVGCGAIGQEIALFIDQKLSKKATLVSLADKNKKAAQCLNQKLSLPAKIETVKELIKGVDLVIEAASQEAAQAIIKQTLLYKKDTIILSVGALLKDPLTLKKIQKKDIKLYVPSGAIAGVDALAALAKGNLKKITLTTSKPPAGIGETSYLKNKKINFAALKKTRIIFSGSVEEAVKHFPKNINVAATLMLASCFPQIKVIIKVDPKIKKNIHKIEAVAKEAKLKIEVENIASCLNPKTSALTILSTQCLLEKIVSSFKVGS